MLRNGRPLFPGNGQLHQAGGGGVQEEEEGAAWASPLSDRPQHGWTHCTDGSSPESDTLRWFASHSSFAPQVRRNFQASPQSNQLEIHVEKINQMAISDWY